ncbi:MAG: ABC transporter ATP-binding protein [Deltaproteobacteria bacterium]|nr:MAG: ABC transporter ATP-binding protein [Deltaproteobacteria bacterium]
MMPERENILTVERLKAFYGKSQILFDVDLSVGKGEIVALIGRNGVGKTTTLMSIMGMVEKRDCRILFEGEDITERKPYQIARMGLTFIPDRGGVFPNLTVEENFALSLREGYFTPDYVFEHFPQVRGLLKRKGGQLSGGERRLVGISRGLLTNPRLLVIDEPSEGLAPAIVREIAGVLSHLKKEGLSMLITDQNLPFIMALADRIYIMDNGQIKVSGSKEELPREVIEKYLAV